MQFNKLLPSWLQRRRCRRFQQLHLLHNRFRISLPRQLSIHVTVKILLHLFTKIWKFPILLIASPGHQNHHRAPAINQRKQLVPQVRKWHHHAAALKTIDTMILEILVRILPKKKCSGLRFFDRYRFLIENRPKKIFFDFFTIFSLFFGIFGGFRWKYHLKITFSGVFDRFLPDFSRFLADQKSVARATHFWSVSSDQKFDFFRGTVVYHNFELCQHWLPSAVRQYWHLSLSELLVQNTLEPHMWAGDAYSSGPQLLVAPS